MKGLFADTFFYLALLNPDDVVHQHASEVSRTLTVSTITTAWVMTEVGDALAGPRQRPRKQRPPSKRLQSNWPNWPRTKTYPPSLHPVFNRPPKRQPTWGGDTLGAENPAVAPRVPQSDW